MLEMVSAARALATRSKTKERKPDQAYTASRSHGKLLDDVRQQLQIPDVELLAGTRIDDVRSAFSTIAMVEAYGNASYEGPSGAIRAPIGSWAFLAAVLFIVFKSGIIGGTLNIIYGALITHFLEKWWTSREKKKSDPTATPPDT